MSTREILTLQFGNYSNYVGCHFWNIQELSFDYTGTRKNECNHDILYREGRTNTGQITYTPRLLIADLKGSLKTLPSDGGLPSTPEYDADSMWDSIQKIEETPPQKNDFLIDLEEESPNFLDKQYNIDTEINAWTDFLYPRFHPRTINIIKDYHASDKDNFDVYSTGQSMWKSEYGDNFSDNIRKYVEECDSVQGFQVIFDGTDAFAGLAVSCIEHLTDEYKKIVMTYPIIPSYFSDNNPSTQEDRDLSNLKDSTRLVNFSIAIEELCQHANMITPLCTGEKGWRKPGKPRIFDYISYNPQLYYHSSALLASAIDTLSQKYRHKSNLYTMSDVCADMTGYGRKMVAASLGLPFTMNESEYLIDYLNRNSRPIYTTITPSCKIASDKIFQCITVRGIPENLLKAPINTMKAKEQIGMPAYNCKNVKEMFELYFQSNNFLSATNVTVSENPLELKPPFPCIFSNNLNKYGFIKSEISQESVASCPVIAGYHNGTFMGDMLEKLHREVSRLKFAKLHKFQQEGLEAAEFKECMDRLAEFKENYEDDLEL